jgi:iron complex outermembrane receptor protein
MKLRNKLGNRTCTAVASLLAMISSTASAQPTLHMRPPSQRVAQAQPTPPAPPAPAPQPAPDASPAASDAPPPAPPAPDAAPPAAPPAPPPNGAAPPADAPVPADLVPPTEGEVIVVTGSRIGDPLGKQAPVLMMSRQDIERTGLTSVGDILQQLPVSGGAINGKYNSSGNFGSPPDGGGIGAGATQADLRHLGAKRVLVLVDGVRWVNDSSASGLAAATDLNTIPLAVIDRVEVLEDGASPIYGSDAIAGVINIITRKDFNGAIASAYTGGFNHGDGFTQKYDVSWGASTPKTAIVIGAAFLDQRTVSSADREISRSPLPRIGMCTAFTCSSATPQGRLRYTDPTTGDTVNDVLNDGETKPVFPDTYHPFGPTDRFNFAPFNLVETPSQRISAFSTVTYKLSSEINVRGKASFNNRQSVNQAAPEPLFIGPAGGSGTRMDNISIDKTNPYNPLGFTLSANDPGFFLARRPLEAGPRKFEQNVNTFYTSGGLDGKFDVGGQRFNWDATLAYGLNRGEQRRNNSFNSLKLQQALGPAFRDANGNYRCGTDVDHIVDPNCVPFNAFGGQGDGKGTITKDMLAFTTFTEHDVSQQTLVDAVANVTGNLVKLPAGWLAAAIGVEHRRLAGFFEPDAVVAAGDSADIPASPTSGSYNVTEGYAELRVPLAAGTPGAELLDLNAAGRISKYSFLDAELTGKFGARWKPTKDLIARGSYSRGFRAPSLGELFGAKSRFDAPVVDPCNNILGKAATKDSPAVAPKSADIQARCIGLGVPMDGGYEQPNGQISVITNGNRGLKPETSNSFNLSLAYSPQPLQNRRGIDSLDFELAYWDLRIDNPITALDAQGQLDRCVVGNDNKFCEGIVRNAAGVVTSWTNALINIGRINTNGLDLTVAYKSPRMDFGRLFATSTSSFLFAYEEKVLGGSGLVTNALQGTVIGAPERVFPRIKSALLLGWLYKQLEVTLTTRYIHSVTENCAAPQNTPGTCSDPNESNPDLSTNKLGITVYNDVQLVWSPEFDHGLTITAGVNNIFNVDPPVCYSCSLNGFNPATYDVPGIFGYLTAAYHVQ